MSLKAVQILIAAARDAGEKTGALQSSHGLALRIPRRSVPLLLLVPRVRRCWVPQLGRGDGVFIFFCLNELVCKRLGDRGLCILETPTWGVYPWRSECQATWLVKKRCRDQCCYQLCFSSPLQIAPRVLCWAFCSLADRFYYIPAQIVFPSLVATTKVQACLGSSGEASIAS